LSRRLFRAALVGELADLLGREVAALCGSLSVVRSHQL
jgi:hypothetical protein